MADPKKFFGGLGKMGKRLLAPEEVAAVRSRGLGVPGVDFADPAAPASMRMSEALGNAGAEGKTLNFTEADRSRVQGQNRGGVGFSGLQHYSKPHKKANTVWGFGNTGVAEKKIRQNDPENSLWTTFVGSPDQHKSNSVVIGDAIKEFQKSVKQGVVPVEQIMLMNKRLNELTDLKTGAKVFQNGFDLTDPSALSVANTFARRAAVGDVMLGLGVKGPMARLDFKNEFPGTKFVDGSNIENILKRETDPDLVDAGTYDVGNRLFVLDGKIIERPDLNEAFPVQVTGTDLGMKFGLVPPDTAMRDFYKAREGRLDKNAKPSPVTYYDLARAEPSQLVDENYLTYLQKAGYKEGGAVDMEAADARLAQAIQARMANGGAVDMEAADARLQAAINARMAEGGGAFKKIQFMAGGGKLKALGDIAKRLVAGSDVLPAAERNANLQKFMAKSQVKEPVFHAAKTDVKQFSPKHRTELSSMGHHFGTAEQANFRTSQHDFDSKTPNIGKYHLNIENPLEVSHMASYAPDHLAEQLMDMNLLTPERYDALAMKHNYDSVALGDELAKVLQKNGYDGLKYANEMEGEGFSFVPLKPTQIKSAIGNRGTYDLGESDITKADGGKIFKGGLNIAKRLLSDDQVASQAIGKAAESAGMKAPVTANKPLTNLQDVYTSLHDRVRERANNMQSTMESMPYKYGVGQHVFTEDSARKNWPPMKILAKRLSGDQPMRQDHPDLAPGNKIGKPIKDPITGKTQRTPYEPGYHVRLERGPEEWSEFTIPESAIKGDVEMARGGLTMAGGGIPHMADAGRVFKGLKSIGKRFMADPAESSVTSSRRGERTADQMGGLNIVKETGGNFLIGRTEKDLQPLKGRTAPRLTHINEQNQAVGPEYGRPMTQEELQSLMADPFYANNQALNNWVNSNLTNYVEKQMGTANDPVRLMFDKRAQEIDAQYAKNIAKSDRIAQRAAKELDPRKQANLMREAERIKAEANMERQTAVNHISHKPALLDEYQRTEEALKKQRMEAGFPEEGVGQSPAAQAWERASDEAISTHRAGDIQAIPEKFAKRAEAEKKMIAARKELDQRFENRVENAGLSDREKASLIRRFSDVEKATMLNDVNYKKLRDEYLSQDIPMLDNYMELGRQNPYINKLAPETQVYAPFTGDLGFDHIMDVLREDLTTGRIRPDQMNKISMSDAVRRTSEYDQELAAKMNASRAAAREGLPTYREYPEGYKWIELNKPGAFSQESEAMGHSVRGYEPPKGHPDWTEASGDAGSSGYGHGGWEAIKSGKAKVYSLVDSKGAPHATVEIKQIGMTPEQRRYKVGFLAAQLEKEGQTAENALRQAGKIYPEESKESITQIKGKGNRAPNEEYLPYVQDFVRGGKWSDVGDIKHTGLRNTSDVFGPYEMQKFKENGIELPSHLNADEQKAMQDKWYTLETGKDPDTGMARGGLLHMADAGRVGRGLAQLGKRFLQDAPPPALNAASGMRPVLPAAEREANLVNMLKGSAIKNKLYHGTGRDIQKFDKSKLRRTAFGEGFHLAESPNLANFYANQFDEGQNVMPVYAAIKNPYELKSMHDWYDIPGANDTEKTNLLKSQGYDGIKYPHGAGDDKTSPSPNVYVAFEPEQIKSATGNRGTYDTTDSDISKAEGGPAFKKLQFMDNGGIASPEENITSDQKPNRFSRVASEVYNEAKQSLSSDYERLKASAIARAQLAKIAAAQLAGGSLDFASMVTPLVNSDALLSAFPMARAAKIGLTGSPSTGRRTSVLSDEKTPYSLADYTNDINGNPRGGSEDIIKRAQKAGLMYGGKRMMYDAQEPDPSKETLTMTPEQYEKLLNSKGRNRIDFGEQITTGRFSPVTEIGTAILGGNLGNKLVRGAVNTGQKFKKGFDKGHARAMSRQAPPFLRELEYAPSKKRGGLTQLKAR